MCGKRKTSAKIADRVRIREKISIRSRATSSGWRTSRSSREEAVDRGASSSEKSDRALSFSLGGLGGAFKRGSLARRRAEPVGELFSRDRSSENGILRRRGRAGGIHHDEAVDHVRGVVERGNPGHDR